MDSATPVYLRLLQNTLRDQILPAVEGPMPRQLAQISVGVLSRMLLEQTESLRLARVAMAEAQAALRMADGLPAVRNIAADIQGCLGIAPETASAAQLADFQRLLSDLQARLLSGTDLERQLAAKLVEADFRMRSGVETAYTQLLQAGNSAAAAAQAPAFTADDTARLLSFLRDRFPEEQALDIGSVKPVPGGFSKQTLLVELTGTRNLPASVVVRRDGKFLPLGKPVSVEYPIIARLHQAGVRVPQPIAVEASGAVLGTAFIVVTRIPGTTVGDLLDLRVRDRDLGLDLARQLAKMHSVAATDFGDVDGHDQTPVSRIRHEIQVERENWRSLGKADAMVHTSFAWLEQHLDRAGTRRALIHRDIGMHNILVDASRVTAFLDWECPVIGNPAEDLGYARYTAMQLCEWDEFLAAYSEGGGMIPSREELDFYTLWGLLRVALIIARARAGVVSGQLPDLGLAYVGEHFVQRLLCRVSETLSSLLR